MPGGPEVAVALYLALAPEDVFEDPPREAAPLLTHDGQDSLGQPSDGAAVVGQVLQCLPDCERELLRLRYEDELTEQQIATRLGMTDAQVVRALRTSSAHALNSLPEAA